MKVYRVRQLGLCCAFTVVGSILILAVASFVGLPFLIRWVSEFDNAPIFDVRIGDRQSLVNGFELVLVDVVPHNSCSSYPECFRPDNFEVTFAIVRADMPVHSTRTLLYSENLETRSDVKVAGFEVQVLGILSEGRVAPIGERQSATNFEYWVRLQVTYPDEGLR